jgi:CRP-like cAMP-binding protein
MTEGWLRYFHTDAEGRDCIRYFCSGDTFVSSQSALIEGEPSEFSIQAIENSTLAVFEYADWLALLESHPAWGIIHKAILDEYPGVEDHVKQYDIASYLGISPASLSRIRSGKEHRLKST